MWRGLTIATLVILPTIAVAQRADTARAAELRYLDRMTGEQGDVALVVGQKAQLGDLQVVVEECRYPQGAISSDAYAYVSIIESDDDTDEEKTWFGGWMVASSPALNALEHPRYDVWVLRCRTS